MQLRGHDRPVEGLVRERVGIEEGDGLGPTHLLLEALVELGEERLEVERFVALEGVVDLVLGKE